MFQLHQYAFPLLATEMSSISWRIINSDLRVASSPLSQWSALMFFAQAQLSKFWQELPEPVQYLAFLGMFVLTIMAFYELGGLRYIPNSKVGIVEKLWS